MLNFAKFTILELYCKYIGPSKCFYKPFCMQQYDAQQVGSLQQEIMALALLATMV